MTHAKQGSGQTRDDAKSTEEFKTLVEKIERTPQDAISIFAFFGFRGHDISAGESEEAASRTRRLAEGADQWKEMDKESPPLPDTEIYPHGEEVAIAFCEDLYPGAAHYFSKLGACQTKV